MILNNKNIILPSDIISLLSRIEQAGFEAYVVGGAVRDALLNRDISDYDITTNATPSEIINIFPDYKIIPTGIQHGTVTLLTNEREVEITTFRSDGETIDNRHPEFVEFKKTLIEDVSRRDFTINALACDKAGNVIDYYNGIDDLNNKIIKTVGNPYQRFEEDGLRILRGLRFAAQLGFTIDSETSNAMLSLKTILTKISSERIRVEFNKMMRSNDSNYLKELLLKYSAIICVFIPEFEPTLKPLDKISYHDTIIYKHLCNVVGNIETPDYLLRLAAYFHDIGKPATFAVDETGKKITFYNHDIKGAEITYNILKRLKYTKEEIEEIILLVRFHNDPTKVDTKWVKRKLHKFNGNDMRLRKLFILKLADIRDHKYFKIWQYTKFNNLNEILDNILAEDECFSLKKMNINGYDMIKLGFQKESIGIALDMCLRAVIDGKVLNNHDDLVNFIKNKKINKNLVDKK